jgi:hypothetical protein
MAQDLKSKNVTSARPNNPDIGKAVAEAKPASETTWQKETAKQTIGGVAHLMNQRLLAVQGRLELVEDRETGPIKNLAKEAYNILQPATLVTYKYSLSLDPHVVGELDVKPLDLGGKDKQEIALATLKRMKEEIAVPVEQVTAKLQEIQAGLQNSSIVFSHPSTPGNIDIALEHCSAITVFFADAVKYAEAGEFRTEAHPGTDAIILFGPKK